MAKGNKKTGQEAIADFLYEAGMLAKTPRSYFPFLGSGEQSVSEHINRVMYIAFSLAHMEKDVDTAKLLQMCLFHDFAEARTSDLNYVHQKYTRAEEKKAIEDFTRELPFGAEIKKLLAEYEARKSRESLLAKDADQLEFIMGVKEEIDNGNRKGSTWLNSALKRLRTESGKKLAKAIMETSSDNWWFSNKNDRWWIDRNGKK